MTYQNVIFFDRIYLQFKIEVEDFRIAFEKYDLKNNSQVQDQFMQTENMIPQRLAQAIQQENNERRMIGQQGFEEDDLALSAGGTMNDEEEGAEMNRIMEMTPPTTNQVSPRHQEQQFAT